MVRRLWEHRNALDPHSYATRYSTDCLVYFEVTSDVRSAIQREKKLKRLHRKEKLQLIESMNPEWRDLAEIYP